MPNTSLILRRCALSLALATLPLVGTAATPDAVMAAYHKLGTSHARVESAITDDSGKVMHTRTEFETLERISAHSDRGDFIVLPEGSWMKHGGEWSRSPIDMHAMIKQAMPLGEDALRNAKNFTDDGATTLNGVAVHAYSYDTEMSIMGMHTAAHSKVFINAAGQIVGAETDSTGMGRKTHSVQSITYDDSIKVKAPM